MSRHSIVFFFFILFILIAVFLSSFYLIMNRTSTLYTSTTTSPFTIDITVALFESIFAEMHPEIIIKKTDFDFNGEINQRIIVLEICDENSIKRILSVSNNFAFITYVPCRVVVHENKEKVTFIYRKNYKMFDFLFDKELSLEAKLIYRRIEHVLDKILEMGK